jgi:Zn-dependent protease with chaperone function
MSRWRGLADGPLCALLGLGLAFLLGLGIFVGRGTAAPDPLLTCQTWLAGVAARLSTVGGLLPAWLISVVAVAAGLALAHQLWATHRVLAALLARRQPLDGRTARLARRAGLDGRLDLIADRAAYTFCYGLLAPRVCLSTGLATLLEDDELLAVLLHEAHHRRHGDPLKILLGRVVASGLFFLPLAGALRNSFLAGKEIYADADAAAHGGELPLARALVKLLQADRPRWPEGVLAVGAFSPTEARLERLLSSGTMRPRLPSAADWILTAALIAGIYGFSFGAQAAASTPPVRRDCASVASVASAMARPPVPVATGAWARH